MRINDKLTESPDHSHYPVCLGRLNAINAYSRRIFFYTAGACILMFIFTLFTVRFNIISVIPNLFGDGTTVAANFVQTLLLLLMVVMAWLGAMDRKIFDVILFAVYASMFLSTLFTNNAWDLLTFVIGAAGTALTFRSYGNYCDFEQLVHTEGYPFFSERLAEQEENNSYSAQYEEEYYSREKKVMENPEDGISAVVFSGKDTIAEMEEVLTAAVPDESRTAVKVYAPRCGKFCTMIEIKR